MKAKIKVLFYYFSLFFLSIIVLAIFLIGILEITVLRPNYLIEHLKENNYYDELYLSISDEMSNYIIQAGLEDSVLENIYTKDMIVESVNSSIYSFYGNQKIIIDTSVVKKNLEGNIVSYLEKNNIVVTDLAALDKFIDQMLDIYDEKIRLTSSLDFVKEIVFKWDFRLKVIFIVLVVIALLIGLLFNIIYRKSAFSVPCFACSILLLLGNYLFFERIDVKNILIWNENVSNIVKSILLDISSLIKSGSILLIILGFLTYLFSCILRLIIRKKSKVNEKIIKPEIEIEKEKDEVEVL